MYNYVCSSLLLTEARHGHAQEPHHQRRDGRVHLADAGEVHGGGPRLLLGPQRAVPGGGHRGEHRQGVQPPVVVVAAAARVLGAAQRPPHQRLQHHLLQPAGVHGPAQGRRQDRRVGPPHGVPVRRPGVLLREAVPQEQRALHLLLLQPALALPGPSGALRRRHGRRHADQQGQDVHIEHQPRRRAAGLPEAVPERLQPVPQVTRRRGRRRRPDGPGHARQAADRRVHRPADDLPVGAPVGVVRRACVAGAGRAGEGGRVQRAVLRAVGAGGGGGGAAGRLVPAGPRADVRDQPEQQRRRQGGRPDGVHGDQGHPGIHAQPPLRGRHRGRAVPQVHGARHRVHGAGGCQEPADRGGSHKVVTCDRSSTGLYTVDDRLLYCCIAFA